MLTSALLLFIIVTCSAADLANAKTTPRNSSSLSTLDNGWVSKTPDGPLAGRGCDCPAFGDRCFINAHGDANDLNWADKDGSAVSLPGMTDFGGRFAKYEILNVIEVCQTWNGKKHLWEDPPVGRKFICAGTFNKPDCVREIFFLSQHQPLLYLLH